MPLILPLHRRWVLHPPRVHRGDGWASRRRWLLPGRQLGVHTRDIQLLGPGSTRRSGGVLHQRCRSAGEHCSAPRSSRVTACWCLLRPSARRATSACPTERHPRACGTSCPLRKATRRWPRVYMCIAASERLTMIDESSCGAACPMAPRIRSRRYSASYTKGLQRRVVSRGTCSIRARRGRSRNRVTRHHRDVRGRDACGLAHHDAVSEIVYPVDRVVVIGAGIAGLAAASKLRRAGIGCVVLEARDRIGGRLHTIDLAGTPVDLGGSWIHHPIGNPF